jgi:hypothetical protein
VAIHERVTSYTVAQLRNDVVGYQQVVHVITETDHHAFIAFPAQPPAQWLTVNGPTSNIFLERAEFDRVHRLLQSESPLFFTALNLFGLRAFSLSTDPEPPGEGPADDDALVQFMAQVRERVEATTES